MTTPFVTDDPSPNIIALRRSGRDQYAVFAEMGFEPGSDQIVIGKDPGCEIHITDEESLSGQHAALSWHGDRLWIRDLDSTNGTKVHNLRITSPIELVAGTYLRLGFVELICIGDDSQVPLTASRVSAMLREAKRVHGSARKAADAVGMPRETFRRRMADIDPTE